MSHSIRRSSLAGSLVALCAAFVGCSTRTNVSATGNTPPQYTHVFITAKAVWFNTSATAGPDDTTWSKYTLTTPATVDLVADSSGTLGQIITALRVPPGTYSQVRLIPLDNTATVADSATKLGAQFNNEADYIGSNSTAHQVPLDLPNPDKGIGFQGSVKIPLGNLGSLGKTPTTSSTTTTSSTSSSSSSSSKTITVTVALTVDGNSNLAMFTYGGTLPGVMLSSRASAYDVSQSGSITGTLTLTNLTQSKITHPSARLNIQVAAETLSADGLRHVVVTSAPLASDGTFTLYPLPMSTTASKTYYDVVIHGPDIDTIIIKSVLVTAGTSASTNAVSLGTLTPKEAASSYSVSLAPPTTPLPAGAVVGFYQTLPASGEVPYVIEQSAIDPFSRTLTLAQALSAGTLESGTFSSSGSTITLTASTPAEGAATYRVSGTAPLFADGSLATTVTAPASGTSNQVTVPTLGVASGAAFVSLSAAVSPVTPGKYNKGWLIVTHDGAVVATAALDGVLASGGTVAINNLPGGANGAAFASGIYYLSVLTWNSGTVSSSDLWGSVHRQWYTTPVDLRNGSVTGVPVSID